MSSDSRGQPVNGQHHEAPDQMGLPEFKKTIFVSFPRSGHHLLMQLLGKYYSVHQRNFYCEHYTATAQECCKAIPCERFPLVKNHDFGLKLPTDLPCNYLVQYRSPLYSIVSNYGLYVRAQQQKDPAFRDTPASWKGFAEMQAKTWNAFIRKWFARMGEANVLFLDYDRIIKTPSKSLRRVLEFIGEEHFDGERAAQAIRAVGIKPSRKLEDFVFYDRDFFIELEATMVGPMKRAGLPLRLNESPDFP